MIFGHARIPIMHLDAAASVRGAASCDRSWRRSDGNGWTGLVKYWGVGRHSPRIGRRYSRRISGSRATGHRTLSKAAQAQRRLEHIIGGVRADKDSRRGNALAEIDNAAAPWGRVAALSSHRFRRSVADHYRRLKCLIEILLGCRTGRRESEPTARQVSCLMHIATA